MGISSRHSWQVSVAEAETIQRSLAFQVSCLNQVSEPRLVAGVDISGVDSRGMAQGAVVVMRYPGLTLVDSAVSEVQPTFPYIPGFLSFREIPVILAAWEKLTMTPDLALVDGQGIAHPRRLGIASHLGVLLGVPTLGCAKSRLLGTYQSLELAEGSQVELIDKGETVGVVFRTKKGTSPVYVSIGHMIDLPTAVEWVKRCCRGYRLPEPLRLAHQAASGRLQKESHRQA
ncbi:MAG: deoxyribonuclease V [Chloroflexi bacterium]|nr:deoxyribonuclease V [Chloroflexota bacterium]